MALYIIETSVYYDKSTLCYTPEGSIYILAAMRPCNPKHTGYDSIQKTLNCTCIPTWFIHHANKRC